MNDDEYEDLPEIKQSKDYKYICPYCGSERSLPKGILYISMGADEIVECLDCNKLYYVFH